MKNFTLPVILVMSLVATACSSMYGGGSLSDDTLRSDIAGPLGMNPTDITIESRRSDAMNTFVTVRTKNGTRMVCTVTGGGWAALGQRLPASCNQLDKDGQITGSSTNCNPSMKATGQCK